MVSIVLPTYNRPKRLVRSLASCLAQTYTDLEVIVVDDGSEPPAKDVVDTAGDPRVRYIRKRNGGLPSALNAGFEQAKGEYLTWTSDDNQHRPEAIETLVNYLETTRHVDFVYSDYTMVDDRGNCLCAMTVGNPDELLKGNCVGACFLYRRRVYQQVGDYDTSLECAEDYDYWLRVRRQCVMASLRADLYQFELHGASLTSTRETEVFRKVLRVMQKHRDQGTLPMLFRRRWAENKLSKAHCAATGSRTLAMSLALEALRYDWTYVRAYRQLLAYSTPRRVRRVLHAVRALIASK